MRTPVKTGQKRAHVNNGTVNARRSANVMRWCHRFRERAPYPAWHQIVANSGSLGSNIIALDQCLTVFVRGKVGLISLNFIRLALPASPSAHPGPRAAGQPQGPAAPSIRGKPTRLTV